MKFVHVAAATAPYSGAETAELEELADATGHPDAIIGGIVPERPHRRHRAVARRADGSRPVPRHPADGRRASGVPSGDVLRALAERDLVFELMAHPDELEGAAHEPEPPRRRRDPGVHSSLESRRHVRVRVRPSDALVALVVTQS